MVRVRCVALATAALLAGAAAPLWPSPAWAQDVRQTRPLQQQAAPQTGQAVVSATSGWTPTGVTVRNGARVQIAAQGRWTLSQSVAAAPPVSGPDGVAGRTDPRAPLANAPLGALIGRIGANGKPFLVGANYDATAAGDGELFLAVNENAAALADNSGRIAASVTMRPVATTPTITRPLRDLTAVIPPRVTTPPQTTTPQTTTPGTTTQNPSRTPVQSTTRPTTQTPSTQTPATQTPPTRTPPTQTVPGTRTPPTQTPPTTTPPATRDPPTRTPPSTQKPPTTQPPTTRPPSQTPPTTQQPPMRTPVDPTTGAPKEPEPPQQPPTTQTPPAPETPPVPASDTPPVVDQPPPAQTTPIEPVPPAVVPAPPSTPASPVLPILAVLLGLGVLATFALRGGGKKKPAQDDPASTPRISARVAADGRSGQELSVSYRGRA